MSAIHRLSSVPALALLLWLGLALAPGVASAAPSGELYLERLEVRPAGPVLEAAVQAQLGVWVGDRLEAQDLAGARERLLQSGWFEDVEVFTRPGSERGAVVVRVETRLDRGARFESGFGHEPLDGWYLNLVGVRFQHLAGVGSSLGLTYQTGLRRRALVLDFQLPRFLGPLDLLVRGTTGDKDWNVFSGDVFLQQKVEESRAGVGVAWTTGEHLKTSLFLQHVEADPGTLERKDESDDPVPFAVLPGDGKRSVWRDLSLRLVYDRRAAERSYRRGFYAAARAHSSWLQGGPRFAGAEAEIRGNVAVGETSGLSLRARGAVTDATTPYHQRPTFGGLASVRGYRDASLSGPFGARGTLNASVEFLTPLLPRGSDRPRVLGVLFVDAGNFADSEGNWGDGVVGVGWGLRVRVPWVDHIAIDTGLPLSPTGTSDPFWVHLGLGVGF